MSRWIVSSMALLTMATVLCAGCGEEDEESSASGVDSSKQLLSLTQDDMSQLCAWTAMVQPAGTKTCPDGTEITTEVNCQGDIAGLSAGCTATVADYERCSTADDCDFAGFLTACSAVLACSPVGSSGNYEQADCGDGLTGDRCDGFVDCANGVDEANCPAN